MQPYIVAFVVALIVAYLSTPYVKKAAIKVGALDAPDERKVHQTPIPRLGGIAIYLGVVVAVFASMHLSREIVGLLVGGTVILMIGIIDDLKPLTPKVKLLGQILAAGVLVLFGIQIEWITNPFGDMFYLQYLSVPITILWVVALTNTVNLIDGLDGLAAGVSTIAAITICLVALDKSFVVAILAASLAGGALGFLQHNFNPAKIFMGDTGSMFLGYMLAAISVVGAVKSATTIALIVPIVALGLPIMDTAFAIVRRFTSGKPIFKADKGHLHHRLLAIGFTQKQAVVVMYLISAFLGASAILLSMVSSINGLLIVGFIGIVGLIGAFKIGVFKQEALSKGDSVKNN